MESYGYSEDGILTLQRRVRRIAVFATVVSLPLMTWFIGATLYHTEMLDRFWWLIIALVLFIPLLMLFVTRQADAQATTVWRAFRIELGDDYIAGHGSAAGNWRVPAQSLEHVLDTRGGLVLSAQGRRAVVVVPKEIGGDAYQQVSAALSQWAPIETETESARQARITARILQVAAFVVVIFSPSRWFALAALLLQAAGYLWLWLSRRFEAFSLRTLTKYLVYSGLITAVRFSPWSDGWKEFLRILYFQ